MKPSEIAVLPVAKGDAPRLAAAKEGEDAAAGADGQCKWRIEHT